LNAATDVCATPEILNGRAIASATVKPFVELGAA
jgi:hypothetical protein